MIAPDVNVLLGAVIEQAARHDELANWLERTLAGPETLGLTDLALGGVMRIATNRRIFHDAPSSQEMTAALYDILAAPGVKRLSPGPRHWQIFARLCRDLDARSNLVADAQHAAIAIEHGATWISLDSDFGRFPDLDWHPPT